ncbi:5-demethoxyubiquinol-8 5-hydroxylase UbiM [Saccharibacter sp. 17.LH.SD]|uniref:5-demethoxyubiquinol-8 5-hydroxylase UbiM n=1 Tax=Saccharibacter sp. 17.LH.SD TaxID=2689393 RepID=UPI00136E7A6B|nr:5-demethoxyubiquinol-8 5-hydroxylase UbiM [Saccharibacter sp. 17.LH.SD]MXV44935.1 5-demethoxyubiquinol-8 5-hydroxylase UbiM [Saccharibacter sp. 17.LH.SD]
MDQAQALGTSYDVIVAGGGPAGLASALSFAREGWKVCVVERAPEEVLAHPSFDGREIALTHHTVQWLKDYDVWGEIDPSAVCPLQTARIESGDASEHPLLFQPPEQTDSTSVSEELALGFLVANHIIRGALYRVVSRTKGITLCCGRALTGYRVGRDHVRVTLDHHKSLVGKLLVGADGRFSRLRDMAGIGAIVHDFGRNILVCRMRHLPPHDYTALQWFDENQTIALLPVAPDGGIGDVSSLVLTLPPDDIARLRAAPDDVFNAEISKRTRERLGTLRVVSERITYPLKAVYAHRFHTDRVALIGDAAVGMHPITAHGFNLGIKGQETLVREIEAGNGDPGDRRALERFSARHRRDTFPLFAATNAIAVAYTRDEKPFLLARRAGLMLADRLTPFKKAVTRLLMDPAG